MAQPSNVGPDGAAGRRRRRKGAAAAGPPSLLRNRRRVARREGEGGGGVSAGSGGNSWWVGLRKHDTMKRSHGKGTSIFFVREPRTGVISEKKLGGSPERRIHVQTYLPVDPVFGKRVTWMTGVPQRTASGAPGV